MAPAAASSASAREVLPLPDWPTSAIVLMRLMEWATGPPPVRPSVIAHAVLPGNMPGCGYRQKNLPQKQQQRHDQGQDRQGEHGADGAREVGRDEGAEKGARNEQADEQRGDDREQLRNYELPQAPVLFELDAEALLDLPVPRPTAPSRFPPAVRDIALLFD